MGDLNDPAELAQGALNADAVIDTAFDCDFSSFERNCEKDRQVILALGEALKVSDSPLVITSGLAMGGLRAGPPAREDIFNRESTSI